MKKYWSLTWFLEGKTCKYFIGYNLVIIKLPQRIMLPGKSVYVKCYDGETKWIYFLIESDELLEIYNHVSKTVLATVLKKLDCKPIYTKKFLKSKNTD